VRPEAIDLIAAHGRGLTCLPTTGERPDELRIPTMVAENTSPFTTAFTVSVEAKRGVSTAISAHDPAATIRTIVDPPPCQYE
jgi:3,4-dihydroxy 2-butanone 4-phosphate synthase/GTP cyclohydrolase II